MAWLYVPGLKGLDLASALPCPDTEPSVRLKSKSMRRQSLLRAWKTAPFLRSLSGMIYPHFVAESGVESWILSTLGSPASRTLMQASESPSTTSGGSGPISSASFAKWAPDGCFWRTCKGSYLPGLEPPSEPFSGTWPANGTMRSGVLSVRPPLALRTAESASSCWPTIRAQEDGCSVEATQARQERARAKYEAGEYADGCGPPSMNSLNHAVQMWPTPDASVAQDGESAETWLARRELLKQTQDNGNGCGTPLAMAATLWPTPVAQDDNKSPEAHLAMKQRMGERDGTHSNRTAITSLAVLSQTWATPTEGDAKAAGSLWQTPTAKCAEDSQTHRSKERTDELLLTGQAQAQSNLWATPDTGTSPAGHGRRGGKPGNGSQSGASLDCQAEQMATDQLWMTPTTAPEALNLGSNKAGPASILSQAAQMATEGWPTPPAGFVEESAKTGKKVREKRASRSSLPAPETQQPGASSSPAGRGSRRRSAKRRLSPLFVCWLQGLPIGWTSATEPISSERLETWLNLCRYQLVSLCCIAD